MSTEYINGPKGHQAPLHETTSKGKLASGNADNTNAEDTDNTAKMLGQCQIGSEGDCSDNVDVGSMRLGVDIYDMLVGATGVQLTEHVGYEITPGITYFKWYSRRGQYKICGDTECACTETRDGDGQPWCGEPDLSFAPCCRADCPCPASWNGQEGQHCGRTCQRNGACSSDRHVTPSGTASTRNLAVLYDGLLLSIGYVTPVPMCTRYNGMMTPDESLSQSYTLECLYLGLRTCRAQCHRHIQQGTSGR